jgi:hypothetical protein
MRSLLALCFLLLAGSGLSAAEHAAAERAGLIIACAGDAPMAVRASAERLRASAATQPLLLALGGGRAVEALADSRALAAGKRELLALAQVVVVGLADDPLVRQAWQHEAEVTAHGLYAFGYGAFSGDIGWVEGGANPWLHSPAIARTPYETQTLVISGSSAIGLDLAVSAVIAHGLVNGVVARAGWQRAETTLLDQDPLVGDPLLPSWLAARSGEWSRIALSQCGTDVARGLLADGESEPVACWLAKYHRSGVWDEPGAAGAQRMFLAGLHRRAYGNALLLARYADADHAARAAGLIAKAAKLHEEKGHWRGQLASDDIDQAAPGPLTMWTRDAWLVMSTLPPQVAPGLDHQ